MEILALLTGRGGSNYKNKNILNLLNKPVLAYPCIEAKKSKKIKKFYVSSDDQKILNTAKKYGFKILKRPLKLSKPNSKHHEVLLHAIKKLNLKKIYPKIIIVLLANAPIINVKWIDDCIKILIKKKATAVVPVIKDNDKHPLRAKQLNNRYLKPFIEKKNKISSNRQELSDCYFLCHNFWVIKTSSIIKNNGYIPWNFMGKKVLPYKINNSHDIHSKLDLKICELLLKKKFQNK